MPDLLVTGAAGFLGREIVRRAVQDGLAVRATDLVDCRCAPTVESVKADIRDPVHLRDVLDGAKAVIHAAGLAHRFGRRQPPPDLFRRINEMGTANVARAAFDAGARHLIVVSSVAVYGQSPRTGADETMACSPEEPYAVSKWLAEQSARDITNQTGVQLTILRLATLYGEGDPGNIGRLMRLIDHGRFIWIGHGLNQKSLLHRDDAARACLLALRMPPGAASVYNVSAPPCRVSEIVFALARLLGRRLPRWHFPAPVALQLAALLSFPAGRRRQRAGVHGTLRKWLSDDIYPVTRFEQAAGFRAQIQLEEGLRREVAWYRGLDRNHSFP